MKYRPSILRNVRIGALCMAPYAFISMMGMASVQTETKIVYRETPAQGVQTAAITGAPVSITTTTTARDAPVDAILPPPVDHDLVQAWKAQAQTNAAEAFKWRAYALDLEQRTDGQALAQCRADLKSWQAYAGELDADYKQYQQRVADQYRTARQQQATWQHQYAPRALNTTCYGAAGYYPCQIQR